MTTVQLAQAQPASGTSDSGSPVVAQFPASCALNDVQVRADSGSRILLPQATSAAALRKQVIGNDLALSAPDLGVIMLRDFVRAAGAADPPVLVLADGTALSAFQLLAWPDAELAASGCQVPASSDVANATTPPQAAETAAEMARVAPAGAARTDTPATDELDAVREGGRTITSEFAPTRNRLPEDDRAAVDPDTAPRSGGLTVSNSSAPARGRNQDVDVAAINPINTDGQTEQPSTGSGGGPRDTDLVRNVIDLINTLDLGSETVVAVLPLSEKPTYSPVGASFDVALISAADGASIHSRGFGGLLGPPNPANVTVVPDPILHVTLEAETTAARNIVGVYQFTADGRIFDVDILWLNTNVAPATGQMLPDFLGQVGDRNTDLFIPPETGFGYFTIADGGGGFNGALNRTLVNDLFADLNVNPRANSWAGNLDLINDHLRFDAKSGRIMIETDPGVFKQLRGDAFFSHDPRMNSDYRADLSLLENSHTISGQANGRFWIGFEDFAFRGAAKRDANGNLVAISGNNLDYNDLIMSSTIEYPDVMVEPSAWQPLGSLGERFEAASDFVSSVTFAVSGLGTDGVSLAFGQLAHGFTISPLQTDAFGNGNYALNLPSGIASTSAVVDELNKFLIAVDGDDPLGGRSPVTATFALTDIYGTTAMATASLSFTHAANAPPAAGGTSIDAIAPLVPLVELQSTFG
jgi:hypothetical protein